MRRFLLPVLLACLAAGCTQEPGEPLAFPGAEGFGKYTTGGPRIVVFEVDGGYPVLAHREPLPDLNRNGIPDKLERRYHDIEDYLNSLVR